MSNFDHDRELPEPFDIDAQHERYADSLSSGRAQDAHAGSASDGAWMPPSFDAAGWIADYTPAAIPTLRAICPEVAELVVLIVGAAYVKGINDYSAGLQKQLDALARARFGE